MDAATIRAEWYLYNGRDDITQLSLITEHPLLLLYKKSGVGHIIYRTTAQQIPSQLVWLIILDNKVGNTTSKPTWDNKQQAPNRKTR